jgi:hypothetical protein
MTVGLCCGGLPFEKVNKLTLGTVCMVTGSRATTASLALELNRRAGRAEQS